MKFKYIIGYFFIKSFGFVEIIWCLVSLGKVLIWFSSNLGKLLLRSIPNKYMKICQKLCLEYVFDYFFANVFPKYSEYFTNIFYY